MDDSPLNRLPVDLRLTIYELALTHNAPITLKYRPGASEPVSGENAQPQLHLLAFTETCKRIRHECDDIFYRLNSFAIEVSGCSPKSEPDSQHRKALLSPVHSLAHAIGAGDIIIVPSISLIVTLRSGRGEVFRISPYFHETTDECIDLFGDLPESLENMPAILPVQLQLKASVFSRRNKAAYEDFVRKMGGVEMEGVMAKTKACLGQVVSVRRCSEEFGGQVERVLEVLRRWEKEGLS